MSGHNKWSTIKHRKGAQDAKRAKVFSRLSKAIIIAAQGGDQSPETNYALKIAIDHARAENMPKDNIERAIKSSSSNDAKIEEIIYEAYGPGNVAMLIACATDSTNRTVSEIKNILKKTNGKFVPSGSVSFQFEHVGKITITGENLDNAELVAIDAGATDVELKDHHLIITTDSSDLHKISERLAEDNYIIKSSSLTYIATQPVTLDEKTKEQFQALYDALDDHPDVQAIFDNCESHPLTTSKREGE